MCRSFGNRSHVNKVINPDTYDENYKVDAVLACFVGRVAKAQLAGMLDFVEEQPTGSTLYQVQPWPEVMQHPRTVSVRFDQCQLGQRNSRGEHVKKPTELVASDRDLLHFFEGLKCGHFPKRCSGHHAPLTGTEAYRARIWPWDFAKRLAWG